MTDFTARDLVLMGSGTNATGDEWMAHVAGVLGDSEDPALRELAAVATLPPEEILKAIGARVNVGPLPDDVTATDLAHLALLSVPEND